MTRGWSAIYARELMILRRRLVKLIPAWSVTPLLYLVAFGYTMGRHINMGEHSYMEFLLPGLAAMSSMTQSFAIASEINVARFYYHVFDEFQTAPISNLAYVLGEVLAGMTRAVLAGSVILLIGAAFGIVLSYNFFFWAAFLLNSFFFASLAVAVAMLVKSHADQILMNNFIITPMAFLGNTFFPLDHLPGWLHAVLNLLPLAHASQAIRASAFQQIPALQDYLILFIAGCLSLFLAIRSVNHARD